MGILCGVVGAVIVGLVLLDAFEGVVLPRQVTRPYRFARVFYRRSWEAWRLLTDHLPLGKRRQALLSAYGPLSLLALFGLWALGLVIGFGLLQRAFAPDGRGLAESLYMSGTTFTTLGYGDVTPAGLAGRVLAVVESLLGLGFLAVVVGYLPVFYQSFARREIMISMLDARAGSPPSGGTLLLRLPPKRGRVLNRFLEEAERWSAEILESQLSYPVLSYYRSQHDNQSWLAALTTVLDASALVMVGIEGACARQAGLTFAMARHAVVDLAQVLGRPPIGSAPDRLPSSELARLRTGLAVAGVVLHAADGAEEKLAELRRMYEPYVAALAKHLLMPLPAWRSGAEPHENWRTSARGRPTRR